MRPKKMTILLVACLALIGCTTVNPDNNPFVAGAKAAAYMGTATELRINPESRPHFERALADLKLLFDGPTLDLIDVLAVAQGLPVKELRSETAVIIITGGIIYLEAVGKQPQAIRTEGIRPFTQALIEGLTLGLR
jgi:hypothetical protein